VITHLSDAIEETLGVLKRKGLLDAKASAKVAIERARNAEHGDFACNIALKLARQVGSSPLEIAQLLVDRIKLPSGVAEVSVAKPGFINFRLNASCRSNVIEQILEQGKDFGRCNEGAGSRVTVEFVSANPTGPLHVGHGRGAAYGATLANLFDVVGYEVQREYYVNDSGRQMNILGLSVWLRYLELCGDHIPFPDNAYQGDYVVEIARLARKLHGDDWRCKSTSAIKEAGDQDDPEALLDGLIGAARSSLGEDGFITCREFALRHILDEIRDDLGKFNVEFDEWFSERQLVDSGAIARAIKRLQDNGHIYEQEGALWFKAQSLGDDKDRVVVRANGETTYFASDIAYFLSKCERGFDRAVYVFGADHHGYIARLKAAAQGLGEDPNRLEVLLVQFAHLFKQGEKQSMSTRSGQFVTLEHLRSDVGTDAARFFYIMRSHEQHLDFDLDLARSQSNDNPVYYVQYAHARICSVFAQLAKKGYSEVTDPEQVSFEALSSGKEIALLGQLARYPDIVARAARDRAPHFLAHYLRELAAEFHSYYNAEPILVSDQLVREARLVFINAVRQVLANGLGLLGVCAPEKM